MKKIFLLIIISSVFSKNSKSQTWQWAKQCGSVNTDAGGPMCLDTSGYIYLTGNFFMPKGIFDNDTIITSGINDIYIVKIDNGGNFIWAKRAGGNNPSTSEASGDIIYEQTSNSILLVGRMDGSNETMDTCQLGSGIKIFLSKLDL